MSIVLLTGLLLSFALSAEVKTLKRIDDPVVIEGREFPGLWGAAIEGLTLMVRRGDSWALVPFQVDQKKPDGNYAFTMGPEASEDPDPAFDADDELVFMAKDTGDSIGDGKWPEGAQKIAEIEVSDPKNGSKGWAYLLLFPGKAARSADDYIRLEIDEDKRYRGVSSYECVIGGPMDRPFPNYIAAQTLPNGKKGADVLDRLKIRGELIFPGGISIPINADEMIKSTDKGYIDGPVRILHLADGYMEFLGFLKIKGTGYSTLSYYVNHVVCPVTLIAPPDLPDFIQKIMPELKLAGFMDFNSNIYGTYPFSAANPFNKDVVLDGRMSEAEKNLDMNTPIDWIAGFGPQGAIVSRLILPGEAGSNTKKYTYYLDDETRADPPEDHPGLIGVGFDIKGMMEEGEAFTSGTIYIYIYFKSELKPEDIGNILDIIDHPVRVKVREVK